MTQGKGSCPHGPFLLMEGCPQCISAREAESKQIKGMKLRGSAKKNKRRSWKQK